MSRYLVVTHQTALSPDLQRKVRTLVAEDPAAEFAVLVPEAPGLPATWEGETVDVAGQRAEAAKTLLEETARARSSVPPSVQRIRCRRSPTSCSRGPATMRSSSARCRRASPAG